MIPQRCEWCNNTLMTQYHDEEWGVPLHDDLKLFAFLILEGAQAGLSWSTILTRRNNYYKAFDHFDAEKMSRYDKRKIKALLGDSGIIRNQLKINSAIKNAQAYLEIKAQYPSFNDFIWQFVDGAPIQNTWKSHEQVPVATAESKKMSNELRKLSFSFVGETICYAFMQAVGMVNDHITTCFRHAQITQLNNAHQ